MKVIKMENSSVNEVYSGVYKITFPNGKIYIGISNNMYRRMLEHNTDFRNNLPIENAIKKYGKITQFEILEIIDPKDRDLMRQCEKYWISYFNSNNKDFGYNISEGGDGAGIGSNNHEAKFTEEEIQAVYYELKNNLDLSLEFISKKYGINISTLSRINNGLTYYHSNVEYPIRSPKNCKKIISGTKSVNSYIDDEKLLKIIFSLKNEQEKSMKELAKYYNVSSTIIQNINLGKTYYNDKLIYPLRKPKRGSRKLSQSQVEEIILLIKNNPEKSLAAIGRELNISSKTISGINCGTIYKQNTEQYPIRN